MSANGDPDEWKKLNPFAVDRVNDIDPAKFFIQGEKALSDNGTAPAISRDDLRKMMSEIKDETVSAPAQAAPVPLTPAERQARVTEGLQALLKQYGCEMTTSLEEYAPNRFCRSGQVQFVPLENWTP